jgi:hypothetical protein
MQFLDCARSFMMMMMMICDEGLIYFLAIYFCRPAATHSPL